MVEDHDIAFVALRDLAVHAESAVGQNFVVPLVIILIGLQALPNGIPVRDPGKRGALGQRGVLVQLHVVVVFLDFRNDALGERQPFVRDVQAFYADVLRAFQSHGLHEAFAEDRNALGRHLDVLKITHIQPRDVREIELEDGAFVLALILQRHNGVAKLYGLGVADEIDARFDHEFAVPFRPAGVKRRFEGVFRVDAAVRFGAVVAEFDLLHVHGLAFSFRGSEGRRAAGGQN